MRSQEAATDSPETGPKCRPFQTLPDLNSPEKHVVSLPQGLNYVGLGPPDGKARVKGFVRQAFGPSECGQNGDAAEAAQAAISNDLPIDTTAPRIYSASASTVSGAPVRITMPTS